MASTKATTKKSTSKSTKGKTQATSVSQNILETVVATHLKADLPVFKAGDRVVVKNKIKEGDKERVQSFEGVVIAKDGRGVRESFTVRRMSAGVGVERVFPLHSPNVVAIEVKTEGFVRRAKLYYLRQLAGKAARIKDRNLKLAAAMGGGEETAAAE